MTAEATAKRIQWLYAFIGMAVLLNFSGLWITVIGPDGALYASIAKNMVVNNNYTDLFVEGRDWLDKPHFPFWMAALSFKIFGISGWAYKLPGVLFVMMGAFYTYKFAKALYNKEIALWSVLILLSAQHLIISNMDVRAEPYLTGLIIASVYYFYKAMAARWFWPLVLASLFAALAVMTKGIFALIPVAGAIAGHLIISRQWSLLFNWRWLWAAVLVLLFMSPELYSLYQQFDAHPEKVVFGQTHVSGLKFFFWDSQFGRFFNSGPIKKANGDPSFFLHTTLWAFLPWSLLLYAAVVQMIRKGYRNAKSSPWFNGCGAGFTFLIFSLSKFQLPHYITIIFPFFAIITAQYLYSVRSVATVKLIRITQTSVALLMVIAIALLHYFFQPDQLSAAFYIALFASIVVLFLTTLYVRADQFKVLFQSVAVALIVNVYFNFAYYPQLTTYQADSEAAFFLNEHNPKHLPVVKMVNGYSYAIDLYSKQNLYYYRIGEQNVLPEKPYLIYGDQGFIDQLEAEGIKGVVVKTFGRYPITRLKGQFLNKQTRAESLHTSQVILIK